MKRQGQSCAQGRGEGNVNERVVENKKGEGADQRSSALLFMSIHVRLLAAVAVHAQHLVWALVDAFAADVTGSCFLYKGNVNMPSQASFASLQ